MQKQTAMEKLPDDLKIEILLHLPVKSLLRFKSVSKSWLSLISDPSFANLHFQRSSQHTLRFPYRIHQQIRSIDLNTSLHDDSATIKLDSPINYDVILTSCRGFLLLLNKEEDDLLLWNPSTGEHKHIPLPLPWVLSELYGFCYDESTHDYLIVLASSLSLLSPSVLGFYVFSVRTNSWEKLALDHQVLHVTPSPGVGSVVNGAIHWLVWYPPCRVKKILAFDIRTRSLLQQLVLEPDDVDLGGLCYLRVFGGSLALIDITDHEIKVWMMKEYGVKSSWTKLMSVSSLRGMCFSYCKPICLTKNGQLVTLQRNLELLKWSEGGELLEVRDYDDYQNFWLLAAAIVYTETLLPLS
ncbi:F-box protein CPR1-like [Prosopis cineraria]|uniref:F-box protein CPR1-like n=1 Tax=Prosopis cineraria TaxID=364024 RepID=UPI00240F4452|nr:F-box protein CPR1-like [Prosopis cineraria]